MFLLQANSSPGELGQRNLLASDCLLVIPLHFLVNLLAMHLYLRGGFYPELNGFPFDADDGDLDAAIDHNTFAGFTGEDEHGGERGSGGDFSKRERVLDRILRGIHQHHLFTNHRVTVEDNGAFQIYGGPAVGVQRDDV